MNVYVVCGAENDSLTCPHRGILVSTFKGIYKLIIIILTTHETFIFCTNWKRLFWGIVKIVLIDYFCNDRSHSCINLIPNLIL